MHDPFYAGAVLDAAARQITDRNWPNEPGEREMVAWSPDEQRTLIDRMLVGADRLGTFLVHIGSRLQRPATATAE